MKRIYVFCVKFLLCLLLFLVVGIICKRNTNFKNLVKEQVYEQHLSFSVVKNFYHRYLGGIFPIDVMSSDTSLVFNEKLIYSDLSIYEDGVKLQVGMNYLVPALKNGIVVYVGEKDKYQNVVMIEGDDGVDIWYGNLCNISVNLYDTVSSGTYLGEVCDEFLYLVFSKGNQFLDYKDYLE